MTGSTALFGLISTALFVALACASQSNVTDSTVPPGVVSGTVYHDGNQNGIHDTCDEPLGDLPVTLTPIDDQESRPITVWAEAGGTFSFSSVDPGLYSVELKSAHDIYLVTDPPERHFEIELEQGVGVSNIQFGLAHPEPAPWPVDGFAVTGAVFEDSDGDGEADAGECGIFTAMVSLGRPGSDSVPYLTGPDGDYLTSAKGSLETVIRAQPPTNAQWRATTPGDGSVAECTARELEVGPGDLVTGVNFGFQPLTSPGSVEGIVFNDLDRDGKRDPAEPRIANAEIFADPKPRFCDFLPTLHTETDEAGGFQLDLAPGNWGLMVQNVRDGRVTGPNPQNLVVQEDDPVSVEVPIRIYERSHVEMYVFEDLNRDGVRQSDEPPAPFAVLCIFQGDVGSCEEVDENGYKELEPLGEAHYTVTLWDENRDDGKGWVPISPVAGTARVHVEEGDSIVIEFPAEPDSE